MKTFGARFVRHNTSNGHTSHVAIIEKDSDGAVLRVHDRKNYTMIEASATAAWLNERANGYPREQNLEHLYNGRG